MTNNILTLVNIGCKNFSSLNIDINFIALAILFLIFVAVATVLRRLPFINQELTLIIKLAQIGEVHIKKTHEVAQIAHQAWTELVTRKAGIPIDPEHDVIVEIYDSWYQLFKEMRLLVKSIPASRLKDKDTKELVRVLIETLNVGLRPHLTVWQSKYRRWYNHQIQNADNQKKTPQSIQKEYEHYHDLMNDLLRINNELIDYVIQIRKLF